MSPSSDAPVEIGFGDHVEVDQVDYAKFSPKSALSAVLGVASFLALLSPLFWVIPLVGVVRSIAALRELGSGDRPLVGQTAARVGLALALLFGTAGASRQTTHRWWLERDAQRYCRLWFQMLSEDQPQKAYQLNLRPTSQQPLDSDLWEYYRNVPKAGNGLKQFVKNPFVRTLLALQDRAEVRYWGAASYAHLEGPLLAPTRERVGQYYTVTYTEGGHKTTFFARLEVDRIADAETGQAGWQIVDYQGGVRPESPP